MVVVPFILLQLLGIHEASRTGLATTYWPGDGHCGGERADGRAFTSEDAHVAHRRLPMGTSGFLCSKRTGLCVWTSVRDRGPFGALRSCQEVRQGRQLKWKGQCMRWRAMTRLQEGWAYRGEFDLTRPVSQAIGHQPFDEVVFFYWRPAKRRLTS